MNLISLMCLCSLSPKSLLLFNGVLQSYLISRRRLSAQRLLWALLPTWTPTTLPPVEHQARRVALICVIGQRMGSDRNTRRADWKVSLFSTLNSTPDSLPPH